MKEDDRKIADLQAMISSGQTESPGPRRQGPNPLYQAVETEKLQLTAEAASLRQRAAALTRQIEDVNQQQLRLLALEPRYQELARERDVLSDNVKSLASKAAEDQAAQAIAQNSNDNIRVVEPAVADIHGKSLPSAGADLSAWSSPPSPPCARGCCATFMPAPAVLSPASAARDLDLPVLATAEFKPADALDLIALNRAVRD